MADYSGDPSEYKVYWFARDLIASSYGSYAKKEKETLRELSVQLGNELEDDRLTDEASVDRQKRFIRDTITDSVNRTYAGDISKRYLQTEDLVERILRRIESANDIREFRIAVDAVVRTSEILETTASFGRDEIIEIVDETLQTQSGTPDPARAYDALFNVDFEGEAYQLGAQREPLIDYIHEKISELQTDPKTGKREVARIISGIIQEYERRAGQSRASTAGNVLETGLQYIFNQFGIPATGDPAHFGDLEIDNMVEGPKGSIGFSCKRTLRERFRQSLSREAEIGVDEVWFVSLLMADVSREKIQDISNDGSRIYVPRDSFVWNRYSDDSELAYTLRPADQFIEDVVEFTGVEGQ
ncbi:hypothetical protein Har1130_18740 [Haloarcula sp. CBA1130]|uniref:hypothetical protein n=1 Tax=unclassified Haloarcula TaxID=2624677 RepID=UPI0012484F1B|nr:MULTISPECIES: hypothetical protein [unclassified Haloarcula]KAA9396666.1 hypothetical protein Har1130_18740 [Haloarcula sp. CBA1130]KAA9397710.1 hypothetical protein Har1129_05525 [Haloarcula sp. CBA1129]